MAPQSSFSRPAVHRETTSSRLLIGGSITTLGRESSAESPTIRVVGLQVVGRVIQDLNGLVLACICRFELRAKSRHTVNVHA
jgi:hypothetical protein